MDLGAYTTHQVRSLLGEEPTVDLGQGQGALPRRRPLDAGRAGLPVGAVGRTTVSLYGAVPVRVGFHLVGSKGVLKVMNPAQPALYSRFTVKIGGHRRKETFARTPTYTYQLEAFTAAVLDGAPVLTPLADSIANMVAIDAIYTASGLGPRGA